MEITKYNELIGQALIGYPELYHDFSDGKPLSDSEIRSFIKSGIETAKKKIEKENLNETFFTSATGNVIVFGELYKQKNGLFTIYINISKAYSKETFVNVEL